MNKFQLFNTYFELMFLKKCSDDANTSIKYNYNQVKFSKEYNSVIDGAPYEQECMKQNFKEELNKLEILIQHNNSNLTTKQIQNNIKEIQYKISHIHDKELHIKDKYHFGTSYLLISITKFLSDSLNISRTFDDIIVKSNEGITKIYNKINQSSDLADELFRILQNNSFESYCYNLQLGDTQAKMIKYISSIYSNKYAFSNDYLNQSTKLKQDAFDIYAYVYDLNKSIE